MARSAGRLGKLGGPPVTDPGWMERWPRAKSPSRSTLDRERERPLRSTRAGIRSGLAGGTGAGPGPARAVSGPPRRGHAHRLPNRSPSGACTSVAAGSRSVRPSRLAALVAIHGAACEIDVPTPEVLASHADGRLELSTLPGPSLHDTIRSDPDAIPALLPMVAEMLGRLHRSKIRGLEPRADDVPGRAVRIVQRGEPMVAWRFRDGADALPPLLGGTPAVVHGDLHDKNVFVPARPGEADDRSQRGAGPDRSRRLGMRLGRKRRCQPGSSSRIEACCRPGSTDRGPIS